MPTVVHDVNGPFKKATFGMGCFWASDALFGAQPGVLRTRVGYSGGTTLDPVYKKNYIMRSFDSDDKGQSSNGDVATNASTANNREDHTEVIEIDYDPKVISYEDLLDFFWNNHEYGLTTIIKRQKSHRQGPFYPAEDYHQKYRLQAHPWLCEALGLTPELLQTSHTAARLNGYLAGVGKEEDFDKDMIKLGLTEKITSYIRKHFQENFGGNLYC
ncbi:hypothetical protein NQ318_006251 [Aromia moschata]|uniref:peptide-methionine (S)-S-oxide reductase n=1 Tax=Aromia moschata TaxID=1265417 RepID=A0AAV8YWP9_9CUCU|nr:hypothetical protein NQ318_006251 [Aromia moschata]